MVFLLNFKVPKGGKLASIFSLLKNSSGKANNVKQSKTIMWPYNSAEASATVPEIAYLKWCLWQTLLALKTAPDSCETPSYETCPFCQFWREKSLLHAAPLNQIGRSEPL